MPHKPTHLKEDKAIRNLKQHGNVFNVSGDDEDLLNADIDDSLHVFEDNSSDDFEDD